MDRWPASSCTSHRRRLWRGLELVSIVLHSSLLDLLESKMDPEGSGDERERTHDAEFQVIVSSFIAATGVWVTRRNGSRQWLMARAQTPATISQMYCIVKLLQKIECFKN
jgi:hypothetical protein